ncbi:MAG: hypothetical protein JWO67_562 [Streptosporangiaceae bacterium]|nr:hypothetical protein [Streptosporangiaceae bacterium]
MPAVRADGAPMIRLQAGGGYVVGAYVASPTASSWDPAIEAEYVAALDADDRIAAFEMLWRGGLHMHDEEWLFANFPPRLGAVLSDVAHVFLTISSGDEVYGIASTDADGRARALRDVAALRDDLHRFNDRLGRAVVSAVELHPGPHPAHAAETPLTSSLEEIAGWGWESAELVIEHSDALVPGHAPEKGFLSLTHEIAAIKASQTEVGIALNWGRSAIEFHDAARAVEHIFEAKAAGLLRGYVFSGASDQNGVYDHPWVDAHNAFARSDAHAYGDPISVLTENSVRAAVAAIDGGAWLGLKVAYPSGLEGGIAERVAMIRDGLDALDRAR